MGRPFRFGVQASGADTRSAWVALARRVEGYGYSTLTMPDHLNEQLAPVPALMAAADATTTLRVGALVFDNDFKHPAVLAKELATMDVLSDGRVEVGIGAGWLRADYEAAGLPYDPPGVRIDRMVESIRVLKALLGDGPATVTGEHYRVAGDGLPKPVQRPRPPILVGGGGRRLLGVAAREADIVGINGTLTAGAVGPDVLASLRAETVDDRVAWVRKAAGERFAGIARALQLDPADVASSPFALIGTPAQIAEDLEARRERWGFSYVIVGPEDVDAFAPIVAELSGR